MVDHSELYTRECLKNRDLREALDMMVREFEAKMSHLKDELDEKCKTNDWLKASLSESVAKNAQLQEHLDRATREINVLKSELNTYNNNNLN